MAGLVAAARLRELGRAVGRAREGHARRRVDAALVGRHLAAPRVGRLSAASARAATSTLQRVIWERLDDAIAWLESRGAPVVWQQTGNPLTVGKRFDPRGLVEALAGDVELRRGRLR